MITPDDLARSGSESGSQQALFCWAATSGISELKWLFAIPNGGFRDKATAGRLKAEGVKSGVADLYLPLPVSNCGPIDDIQDTYYHGLFIEMKQLKYKTHKNGGLSDEQLEFSQFIIGQGYQFCVCYSWQEARDAILNYLGRV